MIKKREFENEVKKYFFIKKFESTGFYYLISRLIHLLLKGLKVLNIRISSTLLHLES